MKRMLLYVVLIVVMAACSCHADIQPPHFLLLRNHGRLVLLSSGNVTNIAVCNSVPMYMWEGTLSRATFSSDIDGVSIEFKLDIIGPDWLFIQLKDSSDGLCVHIFRNYPRLNQNKDWLPETHYANYDAFINDPYIHALGMDNAMGNLLHHFGQSASVQEIQDLRYSYFGLPLPDNPFLDSICRHFIGWMDSEHWYVREGATRLIVKLHLTERAIQVAKEMSLSPEQSSRVDSLATSSYIEVSEDLQKPLAHLALSEDEMATLSE